MNNLLKRIYVKILYFKDRIFFYVLPPKYEIMRGYIHRIVVPHFDDMNNRDEWQKEVYERARDITKANNYKSICDIGCGSGYKLLEYFKEYEITGVEVEPTLNELKKKYPTHNWESFDKMVNKHFDLVILSDVIEHINEPDLFLKELLKKISFGKIIISTPDRSLRNSKTAYGPPQNKYHYREWTSPEFKNFISRYFMVEEHFISNKSQYTQVIVATKMM